MCAALYALAECAVVGPSKKGTHSIQILDFGF